MAGYLGLDIVGVVVAIVIVKEVVAIVNYESFFVSGLVCRV